MPTLEQDPEHMSSPTLRFPIPHRHCSCVGRHIHRRPVARRGEEMQGRTPGGTCEGKTPN